MKKRTAALLSIAMVLSMILSFGVTATAATKTGSTSIAVGNVDVDSNNYTSAVTPKSSNEAIATVQVKTEGSYQKVSITGVAVGTCTVTYDGIMAGESAFTTYSITVTVTASSASTTTLDSQTVGIGGTYNTIAYTSVSNVTSSNTTVATATTDSMNRVVVTGVTAGSANITFTHVENGVTLSKTLPVTVTANTTASDNVNLAVGATYNSIYYEIVSATSANEAVAKVSTSNLGTGQNQFTITGVADGTTTVTVNFKESASGANTSRTITVTVGAAAAATTTTSAADTVKPKVASSKIPGNTSTSGIYIPKRTVAAKQGKTYRIPNIKLDGTNVKASTLRWVASDPTVLDVNMKTGVFKCLKAGSSRLFAVDVNGKYMNFVTITVS